MPYITKEVHMGAILGMRIKTFRKKRKLTQMQLCDSIGMNYNTLKKMEMGAIKEPSFFKVISIMNALGMDFSDLYSPHDEHKNPSVTIKQAIA